VSPRKELSCPWQTPEEIEATIPPAIEPELYTRTCTPKRWREAYIPRPNGEGKVVFLGVRLGEGGEAAC
jgi:hypothetical protein